MATRNRLTAKCYACGRNVTQTSAIFIVDAKATSQGPFGPIKGYRIYGPECGIEACQAEGVKEV